MEKERLEGSLQNLWTTKYDKKAAVMWLRGEKMPQASQREAFLYSEAKYQITGTVLCSFYLLQLSKIYLCLLKSILSNSCFKVNRAWPFDKSVIPTFLTEVWITLTKCLPLANYKEELGILWWGGEKKVIWGRSISRAVWSLWNQFSFNQHFKKMK